MSLYDKHGWCVCGHPDTWHDVTGRCYAPRGTDEISIAYDCDCVEFRQG